MTLQAWRRSAARVTLHPAWPVPIDLEVAISRGSVILHCVVHAHDASYVIAEGPPLAPLSDVPMTCVMFSQMVPNTDASSAPDGESARIGHVLDRIREAMLHELDEFLLVDGRAASSPHDPLRRTFALAPPARHDEASTWRAAITRVSLHPAFGLQVDLGVEEDPQGSATISCAVRHSDPRLADRSATIRRAASARDDDGRVRQLLATVRMAAQRLLNDCLVIDRGETIDEGQDGGGTSDPGQA